MNESDTVKPQMPRVIHLARVVVEARSAIAMHSGQAAYGYDSLLVRDAQGLPTIPGTSLVGVLRHLWKDVYDDEQLERFVFGSTSAQGQDACRSRLQVSWAVVHDLKNQAVSNYLDPGKDDALLSLLRDDQPLLRDHVRLTHLGAAKEGQKFDRTMIPKGVRFSFELRFDDQAANLIVWDNILNLLKHPRFRVGAVTRSGLGALDIQQVHARIFDLSKQSDYVAFSALARNFSQPTHSILKPFTLNEPERSNLYPVRMNLKSVSPWKIGGDRSNPLSRRAQEGKDANGHILQELVVDWQSKKLVHRVLIPGTAIKGALVHRTKFHYWRLTGRFADTAEGYQLLTDDRPKDLISLFGDVQEQDKSGSSISQAGVVYFEDVYCDICDRQVLYRMHNSIDRFTGGTCDAVLFSDELLARGTVLNFRVWIDFSHKNVVPELALCAFELALRDLAEGRLALGSGSSKGQGYFEGDIQGLTELIHNTSQEGVASSITPA